MTLQLPKKVYFLIFCLLALSQVKAIPSKGQKINNQDTIMRFYEDQAKKLLENSPDSSILIAQKGLSLVDSTSVERARFLTIIGQAYYYLGMFSKSSDSYREALIINTQVGNEIDKLKTLLNLGNTLDLLGDFSQAKTYFEQCIKESKAIGEDEITMNCSINFGLMYLRLSQYRKASLLFHSIIEIASTPKYKDQLAGIYLNLGIVYERIEQFEDAIKYYQRAYRKFIQLNNQRGEALCLFNLGSVHQKLQQLDKGILYFSKADSVDKILGDFFGRGQDLQGIGICYTKRGEYKKSLFYYSKAKSSLQVIGEIAESAVLDLNIAISLMELGQLDSALITCKKALERARKDSVISQTHDVVRQLAIIEARRKNYKSALEYRNEEIILSDSIWNIQKLKDINELKTKYETIKKESENQQLKSKVIEGKLNIKNKQLQLLSIAIVAFVLVVSFLFYLFRQKSNQQKYYISLQKKATERSRNEIGKIVHSQHTLLYVSNKENLKNKLGENSTEYRAIEEFYQIVRSSSTLLSMPDFKETNIREQLLLLGARLTDETPKKIKIEVDELGRLSSTFQASLYLVVQEAILNMFKYAKTDIMNIYLRKKENILILKISDAGIGYNPIEITKSTGYITVYEATSKEYGGTFNDESSLGETNLTFTFPVRKKRFSLKK